VKKIYKEIITDIIDSVRDQDFAPGDRLPPERDFAEKLGVSRASVREALRVMEIVGIIETRRGGGSYVTELNIIPFLSTLAPLFVEREGLAFELLDLRFLLELKAAELAAVKMTPIKASYLMEPIDRMKRAVDEAKADLGAKADLVFHERIFEIADHFVLRKSAEFVTTLLEISIQGRRHLVLERAENPEELYKQHKEIFDAIVTGKPEEASSRMKEHLNLVLELYRRE
jgi:GntR family transcriptional regulator, transcriptional repressor for pyruvate dehydrogenase complex